MNKADVLTSTGDTLVEWCVQEEGWEACTDGEYWNSARDVVCTVRPFQPTWGDAVKLLPTHWAMRLSCEMDASASRAGWGGVAWKGGGGRAAAATKTVYVPHDVVDAATAAFRLVVLCRLADKDDQR